MVRNEMRIDEIPSARPFRTEELASYMIELDQKQKGITSGFVAL